MLKGDGRHEDCAEYDECVFAHFVDPRTGHCRRLAVSDCNDR
jgi:hypothetical protein